MAIETQSWLRSAVVYQVFPRLHSELGNFEGVRQDLGRIRDLGADILYIMPIHPMGDGRDNRVGSPYGIHDHQAINPEYGTEADLRRLVDDAHRLGLKVILDVVLHHLSNRSRLATEMPQWFLKDANGLLMCKVPEWRGCADLDYNVPEVWDYQIDTLARLLSFGIDGFRFDVVPLIPIEIWREARRRLDPNRSQIWLAETGFMRFVKKDKDLGVLHHADPELHEVFDISYDADGQEYLHAYFAGRAQMADYLHQVYLQEVLYPAHTIKLRLLENHDDPRFASKVRDLRALRCWTAFMTMLPGPMLLYAGQEGALGRDRKPGEREERHYHKERNNVPWQQVDEEFAQFTRSLLAFMHRVKRDCTVCHICEITRGVVRIDWHGPGAAAAVFVNLENRCGAIPIPWKLNGRNALTGETVSIEHEYEIHHEPLLIELDPATAPRPQSAGADFRMHGGANWSTG